jgi:hypothetical protein
MTEAERLAYNAKRREQYHANAEKKAARLAQCRAWNAANKDKHKANSERSRKNNLDRYAGHSAAWRARNPQKVKAYVEASKDAQRERSAASHARATPEQIAAKRAAAKAWAQANPHRIAALAGKRRATLLQRTPAWLTVDDHWMIEQAYELAALRSSMTGVEWHVDHRLPLKGRRISGLHVPMNLQVIPAVLNMRKHNRFEAA